MTPSRRPTTQPPMPTNLQTWRERVARATTPAELDKLDASLGRLWNAGAVSIVEMRRMDAVLCDRRIALENEPPAREREEAPTKEPVKKRSWVIRVERGGEIDECRYKGTHGPVTAEHVRQSLVVKTWIAGDRLVSICPANPTSTP